MYNADSRDDTRAGNKRIERESIRAQLAKSDTMEEEQRRYLQGLLSQADPKERERQQRMADYQVKKIFDANMDPRTALTQGQTQQAYESIQRQASMAIVPKPINIWQQYEDQDKPEQALAKMTENYASELGVSEASLRGRLGIDPKTGKIDYAHNHQVYMDTRKQQTTDNELSSGKRTLLSTVISNLDRDIQEAQKSDSTLFKKDGSFQDRPDSGWNYWEGPSEKAAKESYDARKVAYEKLKTDRAKYVQMMTDAVERTNQPAAPVDTDVSTLTANPVGPPPPMTKVDPFQIKDQAHFDEFLPRLKQLAKAKPDTPIYYKLPTGQVIKVKP
jgi:hypothetical protein